MKVLDTVNTKNILQAVGAADSAKSINFTITPGTKEIKIETVPRLDAASLGLPQELTEEQKKEVEKYLVELEKNQPKTEEIEDEEELEPLKFETDDEHLYKDMTMAPEDFIKLLSKDDEVDESLEEEDNSKMPEAVPHEIEKVELNDNNMANMIAQLEGMSTADDEDFGDSMKLQAKAILDRLQQLKTNMARRQMGSVAKTDTLPAAVN